MHQANVNVMRKTGACQTSEQRAAQCWTYAHNEGAQASEGICNSIQSGWSTLYGQHN